MHKGLRKSSMRWGIKIIEVMITKVIPDPKIAEDLELETREELQKRTVGRGAKYRQSRCPFHRTST